MKKTMQKLLFALLMSCCALLSHAQQRTVTGTVTTETGLPISNATVVIKGTSTAVSANEKGEFTISANANATLQITAVGYLAQDVNIGNNSITTIILQPEGKSEENVIVTALGIKRSPRSLGYAAQSISGADLDIAQAPTIAQGMLGKIAGLQISQSGGGVEGGSSRIVVRGNTKLTSDNRAMIVVDGVPINNDPVNTGSNQNAMGLAPNAQVQSFRDWGTGLNFISPDDIENVTVLKGPAAAALYGSRGANGVILVTRKKGGKRKGLGVEYTFNDRFTSVYDDAYNFQNEYGYGFGASLLTANNDKKFTIKNGNRMQVSLFSDASWSANGDYTSSAYTFFPYDHTNSFYNVFSWPSGLNWGAKFDGKPVMWYDGVVRPYNANPDNWKYFYPNGNVSQHNVALSGGGDFGTVRFSYTRDDNKANILNSKFNTNTFTLGSSLKVSKKLSADITTSYINHNRHNTPSLGTSYQAGVMYVMPRDFIPEVDKANNFFPDGSRRDLTNSSNFPTGSALYPISQDLSNAFWSIYKNNTDLTRNQLVSSIRLTADLTDWLTLTGQGGIDYSTDLSQAKEYPQDAGGTINGKYTVIQTKNLTRDFIGMARFHKENIANKDINAAFTVGGESFYMNNYGFQANTNGNFVNPFMFNLQNGANPVSVSDEGYTKKYKINSVLGIAEVSFRNYLFLQVTGRNDWTSTLRPGVNSFFYPMAGLSYVFTDGIKGFKESAPWLSYGKIGFNYAGTGSGADPYITNDLINGVAYNGVSAQSYTLSLNDPRLQPQRTKQYELNLALGFFNNRLNLELSGYSQKSSPQILNGILPISSGVNDIRINNGAISNKGVEFTVNATPVSKQNFSWNVTVNGSTYSTKVDKLMEGLDNLVLGSYFAGNGASERAYVGQSYGTLYGRDFARDENGNKIVEYVLGSDGQRMSYAANGQTQYLTKWKLTDTEVAIGNSLPKFTGGIANTFRYKSLSLYFLTDAKLGGDMYSGTYATLMGNGMNQQSTVERNGGGLPYTYPDGTSDNSGMIMTGVIQTKDATGKVTSSTANTQVVPAPWYYAATYTSWNSNGVPRSAAVFKNSWMKFREITLSYQIPPTVVSKTKIFQGLSVSLIGRDLFYIFKTVPKGINPEGVNGIGNVQGIEYSSMPNTRSFGFSVKASL